MELRDVDRVAPEDLKQRVEKGEALLLVDVQPEGQFPARHIVGACNIPLGIVEDGTHGLPRDGEVVLYCACLEEADAIRVAAILRSHGYDRLRVLAGGLVAGPPTLNYPIAGSFAHSRRTNQSEHFWVRLIRPRPPCAALALLDGCL